MSACSDQAGRFPDEHSSRASGLLLCLTSVTDRGKMIDTNKSISETAVRRDSLLGREMHRWMM